MTSDWKEYKLGDLISIKHGYAFKGDFITSEDNGVVLVTPGNFAIGGGFQENKCKFYTDAYPKDYVLKENDLIVTMTDLSKDGDTLGYSAKIPKSNNRIYLHNQRIGLVEINSKEIDKDYLYWFMRTRNYQKTIVGSCSGSVIKHTSPGRICEIEIYLPSLETQRKIARVFGAIDDKIELNNSINKNLEQQMQCLFNNMFPSIYTNAKNTLGEITSFSNGKKRPDTIGTVPVYGGNGILAYTDQSNSENCVIIGRVGAYCGNTFLSKGCCWVSDNAIQAKSKLGDSQLFIYYLLKNAKLSSRHIGTGQPLMTQGILNSIPFNMPNINIIKQFTDNCDFMQEFIIDNTTENERLAQLRDTLLPKLLNNKIDISRINNKEGYDER